MSRDTDTPNSLKKYTCFEWKVPLSGGESEKFLLQNQECLFNFCKTFSPENAECYSLYIQSESKTPLSFEVEVQTFDDPENDTYTYVRQPDLTTVEGIAPYLIWREFDDEATDSAKDGILSFNITFLNVSNIELIEDANAKTEVRPQTSSSEKQQISLKKLTCLRWACYSLSQPCYPRYKTSPRFVINNQACSFTRIKQTVHGKDKVQFTLSIDSEENEDVPHDFSVSIFVDWYDLTTFEGTVTVDRIPRYNAWKCLQNGIYHDIDCFRFYFPSNLSINLIEDADEQTNSQQSIQTSSYLGCGTSLGRLSSDLRKLLQSDDSKPDVTIQCGECTIPAHRIILATRSEVLKTKMADSDTEILQIKDMEASVCRKFIEYLYTASLTDLSVELALGLHEAGKKYAVDSLQSECCDFLIGYLSNKDVPRDILDNDDILNSSQWACFSESQPKLVIQVLQRAYKKAKYV